MAALLVPATADAATAALTPTTTTTERTGQASWYTDPIKTSTGFKVKTWHVDFDISSAPGATVLNVAQCVVHLDGNQNFKTETCTSGQTAIFTHTFDVADLSFARVIASGIATQTCTTDEFGNPVGPCKAGAPISVRATWTGHGPITYSLYSVYVPGVYSYSQRSRSRDAGASATFNLTPVPGQLSFAVLGTSTTKEAGNPCGGASAGVVVPAGC